MTSGGFIPGEGSLDEAVVFPQHRTEFVVRERDNLMILDARHGFGSDHGVDDGLFRGLHRGGEDGSELVIGQHFQVNDVVSSGRARICCGERNENVTGAIAGGAAVAS